MVVPAPSGSLRVRRNLAKSVEGLFGCFYRLGLIFVGVLVGEPWRALLVGVDCRAADFWKLPAWKSRGSTCLNVLGNGMGLGDLAKG